MLYVELLACLVESRVHVQGVFVGNIEDIAQFSRVGNVQHSDAVGQAHIQFLEKIWPLVINIINKLFYKRVGFQKNNTQEWYH